MTPRLATAYAKLTDKALIRDLNWLHDAELIEKTSKGYRARKELILAFLPQRVQAISENDTAENKT